jgi:ABC-2 type transport system ATP-binding protein
MSIAVEHLNKVYGQQNALHDISFVISSGEVVGLIGPNGAGKSTLMKIICGLLIPTSGKVSINGNPVLSQAKDIRRHLGYLPESNPLYTDLFVKEYLEYVAGIYKLGAESKKRVDAVIELTGLGPEKHKRIGILSKGYRQRVGLAQAIIHNPDILILDEPTTGLDPNQIVEIRSLISTLGKEKTVVLSTHIMQEVEAICQRVILLNKGNLVANDLTGNIKTYAEHESHTIVLELSLPVDGSMFRELQGVTRVRNLNPTTCLIESEGDADIRESIFKFAVSRNLVILSLHLKDKKLEEVFRELTA